MAKRPPTILKKFRQSHFGHYKKITGCVQRNLKVFKTRAALQSGMIVLKQIGLKHGVLKRFKTFE